jgi:hypothetical protein
MPALLSIAVLALARAPMARPANVRVVAGRGGALSMAATALAPLFSFEGDASERQRALDAFERIDDVIMCAPPKHRHARSPFRAS